MKELVKHSYRYFPYELELARREVETLLPNNSFSASNRGFNIQGEIDIAAVERLVYFSAAVNSNGSLPTMQAKLERVNGNGVNRQSTRYSAHGLHEYKGKFNPQIVRAILNILNIPVGARIIDPFCGSGTSLLESIHLGMKATGLDINPFAVFIANGKISAAGIPSGEIEKELKSSIRRFNRIKNIEISEEDERTKYLLSWFDTDILICIERLRRAIELGEERCSHILLALASNLLRDYSKQDPNDLRIRRRKTPVPEKPFFDAFTEAATQFLAKLADAQTIIKCSSIGSKALLLDSRELLSKKAKLGRSLFDCAITSPPYATALPYIDTQRLSLVWLGLIPPREILPLEARLVGSREVRGKSKQNLLSSLTTNADNLPKSQAKYCQTLQSALAPSDGFRRRATPLLLYRYFAAMAQTFRALHPVMKKSSPFALVVGTNHTVLGGQRFDIDTPRHLAELASFNGWNHIETIPLQTYQRYGYHMDNAVTGEGLVILRAK